jgi:hypothetical protein
MASYELSLKPYIIYLMRIPDEAHRGCIKIGKAELDTIYAPVPEPNSKVLNQAAHKRIREYTKTASIYYELKYTEAAYTIEGKGFHAFDDNTVHDILECSGIKRHDFSFKNQGKEWYECSVETAIAAIRAAKEGRRCLDIDTIVPVKEEITFRPEQVEAIEKTVSKFQYGKMMLWNAKMRFGKTLCALEVVKRMQFHRTLILTHRPVVDEQWFEDYKKLYHSEDGYNYGSRTQGESFEYLETQALFNGWAHYIFFASIQDLRGAELAGGKFDKNQEIFRTEWDCLIIDEAHEGTQTELGQKVIELLTKERTKTLSLSGTPFNLLDDYKDDEIYTWDYVMEQQAKRKWDIEHFGDPNPYAELPRLNIYTFDLGKIVAGYADIEDAAFNFKEFFRTWTGDIKKDGKPMPAGLEGSFIHEADVRKFLDLIVKYDPASNYPFSTLEYRQNFRHSLWMLPGVKEARALSDMLRKHPIFGKFEIANVAGDGDQDVPDDDAMNLVKKAMGKDPDQTYSITLSCGKLTTGVTVRPWTAVMMLAGSYQTDAKAYMQTIFRVQSPYTTPTGKRKEECFVFDFAPDRTLKVLAETAKINVKAGKSTSKSDRQIMGQFLNFCPVIGYNGTMMAEYNVDSMLEQLKRAYVDKVVRHGFEDTKLYNDDLLRQLTNDELHEFDELHKIIGSTKANHASTDVDINKQGLDKEEYEKAEKLKKKKKKDLTPEEKEQLEKFKKQKEQRNKAISILRGVSIRFPLLIYGAELPDENTDVTLDNFADLVDDLSWQEFMPKKVTKETFQKFVKYYDPDVFRAAGKRIREMVRAADELAPKERVMRIARIFSYFRNPDKETVLTPWKVVNRHITDCLGGYNFYDVDNQTELDIPRYIERGSATTSIYEPDDTRILELNSKTGLYPLFMAYNVFKQKCKKYRDANTLSTDIPADIQQQIWDDVVGKNIFVICKTKMAQSITRRTLKGFRTGIKVNARHFEDLINQLSNKPMNFLDKVVKGQTYWKANVENNMKFNAIVGNPPYQEMDGGNSVSAKPVYNLFVDIARRLNPAFISMIMPSRWFVGGKGLDSFRESMLHDRRIKTIFDYEHSSYVFPGVDIAGGVCYFQWDRSYSGKCTIININEDSKEGTERYLDEFNVLVRQNKAISIIKRIQSLKINGGKTMDSRVSSRKPFGLPTNYQPKDFGTPCWFIQKIGLRAADPKDWNDDNNLAAYWKLLVPKAPIAGQTDFSKPVGFYYDGNIRIAKPGEICTESFIVAFAADTEKEVLSFKTYLFTKIVRFLLLQCVVSQDVTKQNYAFVPDLGHYSGTYTDDMLCKEWGITDEEWRYIDSRVKAVNEISAKDDPDAVTKAAHTNTPSKAKFDLAAIGIKPGDELVFDPTGAIVTVLEEGQVEYKGKAYSLSGYTRTFLPADRQWNSSAYRGPKYFSFKGRNLLELAGESED